MSNSQFVLPNFRLKVAEFNTSKLTDLAASLAIAFSENGTTGITFTNINVTNLNAGNITATGMNISTLTGTNINVTNFNFINETGTNSTVTNMTGTNVNVTNFNFINETGTNATITNITGANLSTNFLRFILATGQNLQLVVTGTNQFFSSPQFYSTSNSNNQNLVLGGNAQLTGSTQNMAIGWSALTSVSTTAGNGINIAIGEQAMQNFITGVRNTVIGAVAGQGFGQGSSNVLIGNLAGQGVSQSNFSNNVCVGQNAGINLSGSNVANLNVFVGQAAGANATLTSGVTLLGAQSNVSSATISNSIGLGFQATPMASNVCVIGNNSLTNVLPGTGASLDLGVSYQPFRSIYLTGSVNGSVNVVNGSFTTTATTYSVLFTGASGTLILPAASTVPGITYKVFNNTAGNITVTGAFINGTGNTPFTLLANHLPTQLTSDGISSFWLI